MVDKTRINSNEGQEILLNFLLGKGFDSRDATLSAAFGLGIIERTGAWYNYERFPDGKLKGREAAIEFFKSSEEEFDILTELVNNQALQNVSDSELKEINEDDNDKELKNL